MSEHEYNVLTVIGKRYGWNDPITKENVGLYLLRNYEHLSAREIGVIFKWKNS